MVLLVEFKRKYQEVSTEVNYAQTSSICNCISIYPICSYNAALGAYEMPQPLYITPTCARCKIRKHVIQLAARFSFAIRVSLELHVATFLAQPAAVSVWF